MDDNGLWLVVIHHESVITEPCFRVLYAGFHTREGLCVVGWWESDVQLGVINNFINNFINKVIKQIVCL